MSGKQQRLFDVAIFVGLVISTFAAYARVGGFDFITYDDDVQIYQNQHIQAGLTAESAKWALTSAVSNNWMPVTLLSHLLDSQLFEMDSGFHHLMNVLFHALAVCMLFAALRRATGAPGMSAFVALIFALHPLHVQSVAWVSERKDVLSALFWFTGLYAYVRYSERPGPVRYALVVLPFCLGLMAKPMLVTFPFTLLLLDIWPLRRSRWPQTVLEKVPLFGLAALAAAVTYLVQGATGAVLQVPLPARIANGFVSYVTYIRQMFWPARLAFYYPFPSSILVWKVIGSVAIIGLLSTAAALAWRTRPYITVGWFWYIGTLVPVIGLVQVGTQGHADRYMYIPMVGLLMILAWGAAEIAEKWPLTRPAFAGVAAVSVVACMVLTWKEASYWQNSEILYQRALDVTERNWLAEYQLGTYLLGKTAREADAIPHLEAVVLLNPDYAEGQNNLGAALISLGDCEGAIGHFAAAIRIDPNHARANYNLAGCQLIRGNYEAAIQYFENAIRVQPDYAEAHYFLGLSLSKMPSRALSAVKEYEAGVRLAPDDKKTSQYFHELLTNIGQSKEAIADLEAEQLVRPDPEVARILELLSETQ
jgi:tetratricopeptide (TPR) repeat protein